MNESALYRIGVLTLSDKGAQGQRVDESGPVVCKMLEAVGDVTHSSVLPDDVDFEVPGMAEVMRMRSLEKTPHAMLSRAVVGVRRQTMIINLPGSPKGARENLQAVLPALPHALAKLAGDPSDCAEK